MLQKVEVLDDDFIITVKYQEIYERIISEIQKATDELSQSAYGYYKIMIDAECFDIWCDVYFHEDQITIYDNDCIFEIHGQDIEHSVENAAISLESYGWIVDEWG